MLNVQRVKLARVVDHDYSILSLANIFGKRFLKLVF